MHRAAEDANVSTPDMSFVNEAINHQRQMASSFESHMSDLTRLHAQQMATHSHENRVELERLANLQAEADKKARMAEQALSGLRDVQEEDRARLARIAETQGVVHNHIDSSTINNTTHLDNQNQHNQVLQLVSSHGHNFAEFMNQPNLNQAEMMRMLQEHVRRNPAPVIHLIPQGGGGEPGPMEIEAYSGPPGPGPSPGGSGSRIKKKPETIKKKDPRAIVVHRVGDPPQPPPPGSGGAAAANPTPTVPTQAAEASQIFDIGTPRTARRPRSRSLKAKPRSVPWITGMMEPEAAIPDSGGQIEQIGESVPMIIAEARGRARARHSSLETVRYPSTEPPQVKPKAKSRSRTPSVAASMRAVSASTIRYHSETPSEIEPGASQPPQPPRPPSAGRAKAKAKSRASIFRSPSRPPSSSASEQPLLPTEENARKTGVALSKVKKRNLKAPSTLLAEIRAVELANEIASEGTTKLKAPRGTTKAAGESKPKKVTIRKVRIASGPPQEIGAKVRGRPKGAVGKAKRDLLAMGSSMVA